MNLNLEYYENPETENIIKARFHMLFITLVSYFFFMIIFLGSGLNQKNHVPGNDMANARSGTVMQTWNQKNRKLNISTSNRAKSNLGMDPTPIPPFKPTLRTETE